MWKSISCRISELCLERTLACGQSFRWKELTPGIWTGVIGKDVWRLKQTDTELFYQVFRNAESPTPLNFDDAKGKIKKESDVNDRKTKKKGSTSKKIKLETDEPSMRNIKQENIGVIKIKQESQSSVHPAFLENSVIKGEMNDEDVIRDYFQLHINLEDLYQTWAKADKHFCNISQNFPGIRMIRQDPVECLFSFICSSNNHISRITSMIDNLTKHYGKKIMDLDDQSYYTFPTVKSLSVDGVEDKLRSLGFGYRAKFIQTSARYIEDNGGEDWLYSLRTREYKEAKSELIKLCGVGAKVADCVALFCLDKPGCIPVDTHVWQIAARDYMSKLKQSKSLTDKLYEEIGDYFRDLWGPYAGWAHSVLFTADLKQFKDVSNKSLAKRKSNETEDEVKNKKAKQRKKAK